MPTDEKPDANYIQRLEDHFMNKVWSQAHSQWSEIDKFINGTFAIWPDGITGRPVYHPAHGYAILQGAVDNQLAFMPKFTVPPAAETEMAERRANLREKFLHAVFEDSSLMEPMLPWKQIGKYGLGYGYTVVEGPKLDMSDKPSKPTKSSDETDSEHKSRVERWEKGPMDWMPFRIRSPHPARVLMNPMEKQPKEAIHVSMRTSEELYELTIKKSRTRKNVTLWPLGDDPWVQHKTLEHWTRKYHTIVAGDKGMLYTEVNTWGFVPFGHSFTGFGQELTNTASFDPAEVARGILHAVKESLMREAQRASGRQNILMEIYFPIRGTTGEPSQIANNLSRADVIPTTPGEIWWLGTPELPQIALNEEDFVKQDIEQATYARHLSGLREPGVTTVGQQAILSTQANRKFAGPMKQLEHLASNVGSNVLRLVKTLDRKITVRGVTIGPDDIDSFSVTASFQVIDPVLALQEKEFAMREVSAGLKSIQAYHEVAQIGDSTGERDNIDEDRVISLPSVQANLDAATAERMGIPREWVLGQEIEEATRKRRNGQTPMLGPDGMPLARSQGRDSGAAAVNDRSRLRQPLMPNVAKPPLPRIPPEGI